MKAKAQTELPSKLGRSPFVNKSEHHDLEQQGREVVPYAVLQPQTLRIAHTPRAQTRRMTHATVWTGFPAWTAAWIPVGTAGMVASAR
jgi:hypothetical protein